MNTRHHVRLRNVRVSIVRKVKADKSEYLLLALLARAGQPGHARAGKQSSVQETE